MRRLWAISLLLVSLRLYSQEDPAQLAQLITKNLHTEKEKVTAIFKWITDSIAYRVRPARLPIIGEHSRRFALSLNEPPDTGALKPLNERVSITVLKNREAICEGYARLFTTLCDFAGIRSEIVAGYARNTTNKPTPRFGVNHYWNAVMIDGEWYLADATWASGFVTHNGEEFVREFDSDYFLSSPERFIKDHYPDDIRWTLLPDTKVPPEFKNSPFMQKSFAKYSITSFFPRRGVIEAAVGDTIRLELSTANPERDKFISPDMLVDSTIFSESPAWVFLRPATGFSDGVLSNRHQYILPVTKPGIEWVYLMYNDDMVLRYKVNIRPE